MHDGATSGETSDLLTRAREDVARGDYSAAWKKGTKAAHDARKLGDHLAAASALQVVASSLVARGWPRRALDAALEAVALVSEHSKDELECASLASSFMKQFLAQRQAKLAAKISEAILPRLRQTSSQLCVLQALRDVQRTDWQLQAALDASLEVYRLACKEGLVEQQLMTGQTHAELLLLADKPREAEDWLLELHEAIQDQVRRIDTKTVRLLSKAALLAGAPQRAELRARDAQAVSCKRADLEEEARAFMALALAQHASGNTDSAMFSVTEARQVFKDADCAAGDAEATTVHAYFVFSTGDASRALDIAADARVLASTTAADREVEICYLQALIQLQMGRLEEARMNIREAQRLAVKAGDVQEQVVGFLMLSQAYILDVVKESAASDVGRDEDDALSPALRRALHLARDAVPLCKQLGDKALLAVALLHEAKVWFTAQRLDYAVASATKALNAIDSVEGPGRQPVRICQHIKAHVLLLGAEMQLELGNVTEAQRCMDIAAPCCDVCLPLPESMRAQFLCGTRLPGDLLADVSPRALKKRAQPAAYSSKKGVEKEAMPLKVEKDKALVAEQVVAAPKPADVAATKPEGVLQVQSSSLEAVRKTVLGMVTTIVSDDVEMDSPLMAAGVDSLSSLELANRMKKHFSIKVPPTLVFEHPSVAAIVDFVLEEVEASS